MHSSVFEAIGTHWRIDIVDTLPQERYEALLGKVRARIAAFDAHYSRFRPDSLVAEMSRTPGVYALPEDAQPMLDLYRDIYGLTRGLVTPLIGDLLSDAGYDAEYSLQPKTLRAPLSWDEALAYSFPNLEIKKPVLLDFGAAGKGYLVDLLALLLQEEGLHSFTINAGGDIRVCGAAEAPVRIGLEHPAHPEQVIGVVALSEGSICGSAGNRRAWGEFNHIMNPDTKTSVREVLATWVVAQSALLADALATCLFFVPASGLAGYQFSYLTMYADGSVERSPEFPGELFFAS